MAWFETLNAHWYWLVIGLILAAVEMAAPGFFTVSVGLLSAGLVSVPPVSVKRLESCASLSSLLSVRGK